jgi:hypothetical protein
MRFFPLDIHIVDSALVIRHNFTDVAEAEPGGEILAVNGRDTRELIRQFMGYSWSDGFYHNPDRIDGLFSLLYSLHFGYPDSFQLDLRRPGKPEGNLTVPALPQVMINDVQSVKYPDPKKYWAYRYKAETKTAIIDIEGFEGKGYMHFLAKSFADIRKQGATSLIIDLRGNGGGEDNYPLWLFRYIALEPFMYYDHLSAREINWRDTLFRHVKGAGGFRKAYRLNLFRKTGTGTCYMKKTLHYNLRKQPFDPRADGFKGRVYLLVDPYSFSASTEFGAIAHETGRCTIIGQETMGGHCGNNSGDYFVVTLPCTNVKMYIPTYRYVSACRDCPYGRGVIPHHLVRPAPSDLAGHDSVMAYTLRLIREQKDK